MKNLLFIILLLGSQHCFAWESDAFTSRVIVQKESSEVRLKNLTSLNNAVNTGMKNALKKFNEKGNCRDDLKKDPPKIYRALKNELIRSSFSFTGVFEKFAEESGEVTIHPGNGKLYDAMSFSPQGILNLGGHVVGPDKLGHFMDEGFELFEIAVIEKKGVKEALEFSSGLENGKFGLLASGVRSYGDMAANLGGLNFWNNILGGQKPYLSCDESSGLYKLGKDFNWAHYVDDSWDEGINCNTFWEDNLPYNKEESLENKKDPSSRMKYYDDYLKNMKPPMSCPVEKEKCEELSKMKCAKYIMSPVCLEINGGNSICEIEDLMTIKPSGDTLDSERPSSPGSGARSLHK